MVYIPTAPFTGRQGRHPQAGLKQRPWKNDRPLLVCFPHKWGPHAQGEHYPLVWRLLYQSVNKGTPTDWPTGKSYYGGIFFPLWFPAPKWLYSLCQVWQKLTSTLSLIPSSTSKEVIFLLLPEKNMYISKVTKGFFVTHTNTSWKLVDSCHNLFLPINVSLLHKLSLKVLWIYQQLLYSKTLAWYIAQWGLGGSVLELHIRTVSL